MPDLSPYLDWIEAHKTTVDLVKWGALLFIAWLAGAFRLIRGITRKPKVEIQTATSRCLIQEFPEFRGHTNVMRVSFLLEVGITNPTNEKISVKNFYLSFHRQKFWRRWKPELHAISLPNRPRYEMGSGTKLLKCWFSNFPDGMKELTLSGDIDARAFSSGHLLFVSFTHGNWNPRIHKETIKVRTVVELTTGEIRSHIIPIKISKDPEQFEKWVPGIIDQVEHETAWNAVR